MFRLQGMDPTKFVVEVTPTQLGQQLGNAMSVNVVERVLYQVILATALVDSSSIADRWQNGSALKQLKETRGKTFKDSSRVVFSAKHQRIVSTICSAIATGTRKWILDSGAPYHLIDEEDLTEAERKTKRDLPLPIGLSHIHT